MKPAPFTYHVPGELAAALELLATLEGARLLAGGQSLMPMMNFRYVQPDNLIDLNRVAGLAGIEVAAGQIRIGAMTRQRDLEFSAELAAASPVLAAALQFVGHRQTRNRGTIGGSLCHLDPSAELVNCILLHDGATIEIGSARRGSRALAFEQFALGYMTHALEPDEMVTAIRLPSWAAGHGHGFAEVARRHGDFAIAAVGALIQIDPASGRIVRAAVAVSGVAAVPFRLAAVERAIIGERADAALFDRVAGTAEAEAMADAYVTADYRLHLMQVLTRRALKQAAGSAWHG